MTSPAGLQAMGVSLNDLLLAGDGGAQNLTQLLGQVKGQ